MDNKLLKPIKVSTNWEGGELLRIQGLFSKTPFSHTQNVNPNAAVVPCSAHRNTIFSDGDDLGYTQFLRYKTGRITQQSLLFHKSTRRRKGDNKINEDN